MTDSTSTHLDTVYALADAAGWLFAARKSGLYRSADAGATWESAFASLEVTDTVIVTALATYGNTIFAGANGAILRSDDGGSNWHVALLPSPAPVIAGFAVSPNHAEDGVIVAGTAEDGIFVSTDRGDTWVPWNFGLIDLNVYSVAISPDFARDRIIFAGTESGIFRSKNGGRSWHDLPFPMDAAPVVSLALSPTYPTDGLLYAGTAEHGLYASDDFGVTWHPRQDALIDTSVNVITAAAAMLWLLLDDKLVVSRDAGVSWELHANQFSEGKLAMSLLLPSDSRQSVLVGMSDGDILALS